MFDSRLMPNSSEQPRRYLYIDGAAFLGNFKEMASDLANVQDIFSAFNFSGIAGQYQRLFFYDTLPVKKPGQNEDDYMISLKEKEIFFRLINQSPKCHVRSGIARHRKNRGQEQKGVDVLLAVDVMQHAYAQNADEFHFIMNDLDFFPILEALTHTRTQSTLIYRENATSQELIACADIARPINLFDWGHWLNQPYARNFCIFARGSGGKKFKIESPSVFQTEHGIIYEIGWSPEKKAYCAKNNDSYIAGGSKEIIFYYL